MNTRHYLRLVRTFALVALTAAATAACSDDNDEPAGNEPPTSADGIPVAFTADINPGSDANPAANPETRTVLTPDNGGFAVTWKGRDNYPIDYDKISIWAASETNTLANDGNSKTYAPTTSDVSSALEPKDDGNKLTLPSTGEWKFTAIYGAPIVMYGKPIENISSLTQSAPGNTEHIARQDFSVATATQAVEAGDMPQSISLGFKHLLSALQLHVTNTTGAELTVNEIRLSAAGGQITCKKSYDVAAGDWVDGAESNTDYLRLQIATPAPLADGGTEAQNFHMLLFPGYGGTDMTITVLTSRGKYALTKTAPATGFEAGKNYMTNIAVKSTDLKAGETWMEPLSISTADELAAFRDNVNNGNSYSGETVRLAASIDLPAGTWTPIGTSSTKPFQGTFDGQGYHISGLKVDNGSAYYAGLFGYLNGTVKNLRVSGDVKTAGYYAGGIVGYFYGTGVVENCIFSGTVNGKSNVGGIAGWNSGKKIAGCYAAGSVTATGNNAGGIVGENTGSSPIENCYSEAKVKADKYAGGIVGENGLTGTVTHCYATGNVSGSQYVGGIVGYNNTGTTVKECIALNPGLTRTEGSTETTFGRVVGSNVNGTVTDCGAFNGMTMKDAGGATISPSANADQGTDLAAAECLTKATYTATYGFPVGSSGWAFDSGSPWQWLPWNPAFASFPGIKETDYRIEVPQYIKDAPSN